MSQREDWIREVNELLLNQGKLELVPKFFSTNYVAHVQPVDFHGDEAIVGFVKALRGAFPDLKVEVTVLVEESDRIAWLRTLRGTHRGELAGIPASGGDIVWQDMVVSRLEDGKIIEEWGVSGIGVALYAA
jgi:predicted ester cyclase